MSLIKDMIFPGIGVSNWDFTIGTGGKPVLIEANLTAGGVWLPQMAHGCGVFGAVVVGGVYIADGTAIGANAVVTKSFTEGYVTLGGVPAKIVSQTGSEAWNKKNKN